MVINLKLVLLFPFLLLSVLCLRKCILALSFSKIAFIIIIPWVVSNASCWVKMFLQDDILSILSMGLVYLPIHEWLICNYGFHVGKYTSPMDVMGKSMICSVLSIILELHWISPKKTSDHGDHGPFSLRYETLTTSC